MTRKLISMFVAAAALATGPLAAQNTFGLVAGVVSAKTTVSGGGVSLSFDSRTGFAGGVSMSHPITKDFDFAPELLYIQKGFQVKDGNSTGGTKVAYVELPLLFRAKFGSSDTKPFVLAGPTIGVKASCKITASSGGTSGSTNCTDGDIGLKSTDFGVMLGGGVAFNRFSVSVRYDLGLANTLKGGDAGVSYKNRALLALVGVSL